MHASNLVSSVSYAFRKAKRRCFKWIVLFWSVTTSVDARYSLTINTHVKYFSLLSTSIFTVRSNSAYPQPRAFHCTTILGTNIYIYGGLDQFNQIAGMYNLFNRTVFQRFLRVHCFSVITDDVWFGTLTFSSDMSSFVDLIWTKVDLGNPLAPPPRAYHSGGGALSSMFIFGGMYLHLLLIRHLSLRCCEV